MYKIIEPDRKLFIKQIYILLTFSIIIILAASIIHGVVALVGEDPSPIRIFWYIVITLLILLWVISVPLVKLWINNLKYSIRVDRIAINKGILTKVEQNIPFRSITDFQLYRSLYDRALGIGSIKIQTAGQSQSASGYEGVLSGLTDFESLHSELREKVKSLYPKTGTGTSAATNSESGEQTLKMILEEIKYIRKNIEK